MQADGCGHRSGSSTYVGTSSSTGTAPWRRCMLPDGWRNISVSLVGICRKSLWNYSRQADAALLLMLLWLLLLMCAGTSLPSFYKIRQPVWLKSQRWRKSLLRSMPVCLGAAIRGDTVFPLLSLIFFKGKTVDHWIDRWKITSCVLVARSTADRVGWGIRKDQGSMRTRFIVSASLFRGESQRNWFAIDARMVVSWKFQPTQLSSLKKITP